MASDRDPIPPGQTGYILVVDDDATSLKNLRRILENQGHRVATYANPVRALERLESESFDLLLTDLKMPHLDGMELLDRVKAVAPEVEVIIISGFASLEGAVEATKKGAYHFLAKPCTPQEVRRQVALALAERHRRQQAEALAGAEPGASPLIIGQSPGMERVAAVIAQIAPTDCNVLITGESGTGKELAARSIHAQGPRAAGPWVAFNCAAFNPELMENELFGHEKGAFTGAHQAQAGLLETAQGGTLFLDEIGEMPLLMQVKLLRALQEREILRVGGSRPVAVDFRVVAATARDLKAEVAAGAFRQDLYFRLNVVHLELPSLAERQGDIPLLAYHYLHHFARRMNHPVRGLHPEALELLCAYAFPGNVRELMNIMERAVALCRGELILPRDLPPDLAQVRVETFQRDQGELPTLEELERDYIQHVLKQCGGVRAKAAGILGIDRVSLWRKMKRFELE